MLKNFSPQTGNDGSRQNTPSGYFVFFEGLRMSTNIYDVNFLRKCSPRKVTVSLLAESEFFFRLFIPVVFDVYK